MKKTNPTISVSTSKLLLELSYQLYQFGEPDSRKKIDLLRQLKKAKHFTPLQLKEYQRCVLFVAAYPETLLEYTEAIRCLKTLAEKTRALGASKLKDLEQSGLPNTPMFGVYSYHLIRWLLKSTGIKLRIAFIEESAIHPREALRASFNELEFELEANNTTNPIKWLEAALGTTNRETLLHRLVIHIEGLKVSDSQKDHLFEAMRVCVSFHCDHTVPFQGISKVTFFHKEGLIKRFDENALISAPLPKPKTLSPKQYKELMACARISLLNLNRETDPVSLCAASGIEYYELERGFSIALFTAVAERRLPLESYIGFMMFKNGFPISYGGAWLFGKRSLLGINIYESYRGGESAYLFSQLLRTYKHRFSPTYIEVEPYQFGKGNPEGIKTGAFWFYYRFGFRPVDKHLRTMASKEFTKIQKNKNYRSPSSVLKKFTHSNMMLSFQENSINLEPATISAYITENIHLGFQGNRMLYRNCAVASLKKELGIHVARLNKSEKIGLEKLYAFVFSCLAIKEMTEQQKSDLKDLILEKGKSEFKYAEACEQFPFEKFITPLKLREQLGLDY